MKTSENCEIKPLQIAARSPKPRKYLYTKNYAVYSTSNECKVLYSIKFVTHVFCLFYNGFL